MLQQQLSVAISGRCTITDDLGNILLEKANAVHPQNLARIIARALAREPNSYAYRIAFGNGGTQVASSLAVEYNTANDGISPDIKTWNSEIYNETYSEVIDDSDPLIGADVGSAGRPAGGDNRADDPATIEHVSGPGTRSNELGLQSEVVITCTINPGEPRGQAEGDTNPGGTETTTGEFIFDEIGIYTKGAPHVSTSGYQNIDVGGANASDLSGLAASTQYSFRISANSGTVQVITFTTPAVEDLTYQNIISALLTGDTQYGLTGNPAISGANIIMSGDSYNSQTSGFLTFVSQTSGPASTIVVSNKLAGDPGQDFVSNLNPPTGGIIKPTVPGAAAGLPNSPTQPEREGERLLAHCIFSPVTKNSNRTIVIRYVLTISVARTTAST